MRNEQRLRASTQEHAREPQQRVRGLELAGAASGVGRRQDHPLGVELQHRDLTALHVAVVLGRCDLRWRQDTAGLARAVEGEIKMIRKVQDGVVDEPRRSWTGP